MSKIEEYEKVESYAQNDVVLIDGSMGTRIVDISKIGSGSGTKADKVIETVSGPIATFSDGAADKPVQSLIASILPVQEGTGDPSPENVRPISGWTGCKIGKAKGDNLYTFNGIGPSNPDTHHVEYDDSGLLKVWGNGRYASSKQLCTDLNLVPGKTYVIMANATSTSRYAKPFPAIAVRNAANTVVVSSKFQDVGYSGPLAVRFTYDPAIHYYVSFFATWEEKPGEVYYDSIGLYEVDTIDISFPTSAGTVYGGTLNVTTGELTVTWFKTVVTDLDHGWTYYGAGQIAGTDLYWGCCANYSVPRGYGKTPAEGDDKGIFSHGKWQYDASEGVDWRCRLLSNGAPCPVFSHTSSLQSTAAMNQFLKNLDPPMEIAYELAEPITYNCTPTEVRTLLGSNAIFADTGDVTVEYAADTKTYIDAQIAALVATLSTL